jgi:hypothetical protein
MINITIEMVVNIKKLVIINAKYEGTDKLLEQIVHSNTERL